MNTKSDYVTSQPQSRPHTCHWPGCTRQVPPAMWGCKKHWFKLPREIQRALWANYRPGQEIDGKPSDAYLRVAHEAQVWIRENYRMEVFQHDRIALPD